jgi:hypothetical protein
MTHGAKYFIVLFLLLFFAGRTAHCALSFNCYQLNNKFTVEKCNKGTLIDKKEYKTTEQKSIDFISADATNYHRNLLSNKIFTNSDYLPHKKFINSIYISNLSLLI